MTPGAADRQLKSILDRILRLKEEQDALGDDIREIYAEAKSNGYDKTALGVAVATIRKQAKDPTKFSEQEAIVGLYLAAYFGTGTVVATHTHEANHLPAASNRVSDTENESRPALRVPRREALRDDAQPEGGMTGGSRPAITDRHGLMLDDIPPALRRTA